jgi:hypothetical protein
VFYKVNQQHLQELFFHCHDNGNVLVNAADITHVQTLSETYTVKLEYHVASRTIPADTVELHLSGRWLSGSPIVRIGLARRVNLSRIL